MKHKERIIAAVNHRQTDYTPYTLGLTQQAQQRLDDFLGHNRFASQIDNPIITAYYDGWLEEIKPGSGYWRDAYGVLWNRNGADKDIGVIEGQVMPEPDLSSYKFPELDESRLRSEYEKQAKADPDIFKFGAIGFSLYERAWTLRGMEDFLIDMAANPDFAEDLLDAITDYNLKIIDIALEYPIDGFHFGDDWGQQNGMIMGPAYWRRFIKPRLARMYKRAKDAGKIISQHSCGDIQEVFPDLIDIGLDIYQTVQPEIYDMKQIKRDFGQHLTFWGGISTQRLLPYASPEEVKRVTLETISILGAGGGYIAAPTHSIPGDVPPENILAMLEIFQNQNIS